MKKVLFGFTASLLLILGACSNDAEGEKNTEAAPDPKEEVTAKASVAVTDFAGREIDFDGVPKNIVSLGAGELDLVYALGGELVGRPTQSGEESSELLEDVEQVGNTHNYDLEKITSLQPDVVLANNPMNLKDIEPLESTGAQVILTQANSVSDIQKQITLFGEMLQEQGKASEINQSIDESIQHLKAEQSGEMPRVLLVYGAPGTYMAALPNSLSGDLLEMAGGENIASDYPELEAYPQYAQLNAERIVESNPEHIFLMTHADPATVVEGFKQEMEQNPSWNSLDAVKNDNIEVLPADLFGNNPGTKVTEAMEYLASLLQPAE